MLIQFIIAILNVFYIKMFFSSKDQLVSNNDVLGMMNLGFLFGVLLFINYKFLYEPILKQTDKNKEE